MGISIIVCTDMNDAIGKENSLPWHQQDDLQRFKKLTEGKTVIMGRKTWESLPKKPLPNRNNIVITRDEKYVAEGAMVSNNLKGVLQQQISKERFVIGGAEIYKQALPYADTIYKTVLDVEIEDADAFFPQLSDNKWVGEIIDTKMDDEKNDYYATYMKYTIGG